MSDSHRDGARARHARHGLHGRTRINTDKTEPADRAACHRQSPAPPEPECACAGTARLDTCTPFTVRPVRGRCVGSEGGELITEPVQTKTEYGTIARAAAHASLRPGWPLRVAP